jgi:hypothetical protein
MQAVVSIVSMLALLLGAAPAHAVRPCEDLKAEIAAKLDAAGVKAYVLTVLANAQVADASDAKVVGSCDGGTKKIVYKKGG